MKNSNMLLSRAFTVLTVAVLVFALSASGALAGFWRTLDGITANGVPNPAEFLFGQGTDGTTNGIFGYGYGYGFGDFDEGFTAVLTTSSSGGGSGGSSSSSSTSSTSSSSSGGGSSSGNGSSSTLDNCPNGDTSGSRFDGTCGTPTTSSSTSSTSSTSSSTSSSSSSSSTGGGSFTRRTYPNEPKIATCGVSIVKFNDIAGNTFEQHIINLEAISGLNGNGDGKNFSIYQEESKSFQPNRAATRSEYIKMVFRALCIDYSPMNSTLDDFADGYVDPWQAKVFNKAVDMGWVTTNNSLARVNDTISRVEALKIIMQAGVLDALSTPTTSSFSDVASGSWESKYTEAALGYGIIAGNSTFRPTAAITRGESAKLIMNTLY